MFYIFFYSNEFDFGKITTFDLNPDPNTQTNKMFSGNPYPFGMDPVNDFFTKYNFRQTFINNKNLIFRCGK